MTNTSFFVPARMLSVKDAALNCGAELLTPHYQDRQISSISSLENAVVGTLLFASGKAYEDRLASLPDCTIICTTQLAPFVGKNVAVLVSARPQQAFGALGRLLFPDSIKPQSYSGFTGIFSNAHISKTAIIEADVTVEAGAVIGEFVEIGSGTIVGPSAVIGARCKIGRDCVIGPGATITNSLLGNRVLVHSGARLGQDGFGFTPGVVGLEKMPHIGRVVLQDDVEIGANTTIDRGALADTVIGEGTKIDNLVQIAHNVRIGRNCVITGHCGLSGSVTLGDNVMLGGRVGIADHVTLGNGVQVAAASGVMNDIPDNERWGGLPAQPLKQFFRELSMIRTLAREKRKPSNE